MDAPFMSVVDGLNGDWGSSDQGMVLPAIEEIAVVSHKDKSRGRLTATGAARFMWMFDYADRRQDALGMLSLLSFCTSPVFPSVLADATSFESAIPHRICATLCKFMMQYIGWQESVVRTLSSMCLASADLLDGDTLEMVVDALLAVIQDQVRWQEPASVQMAVSLMISLARESSVALSVVQARLDKVKTYAANATSAQGQAALLVLLVELGEIPRGEDESALMAAYAFVLPSINLCGSATGIWTQQTSDGKGFLSLSTSDGALVLGREEVTPITPANLQGFEQEGTALQLDLGGAAPMTLVFDYEDDVMHLVERLDMIAVGEGRRVHLPGQADHVQVAVIPTSPSAGTPTWAAGAPTSQAAAAGGPVSPAAGAPVSSAAGPPTSPLAGKAPDVGVAFEGRPAESQAGGGTRAAVRPSPAARRGEDESPPAIAQRASPTWQATPLPTAIAEEPARADQTARWRAQASRPARPREEAARPLQAVLSQATERSPLADLAQPLAQPRRWDASTQWQRAGATGARPWAKRPAQAGQGAPGLARDSAQQTPVFRTQVTVASKPWEEEEGLSVFSVPRPEKPQLLFSDWCPRRAVPDPLDQVDGQLERLTDRTAKVLECAGRKLNAASQAALARVRAEREEEAGGLEALKRAIAGGKDYLERVGEFVEEQMPILGNAHDIHTVIKGFEEDVRPCFQSAFNAMPQPRRRVELPPTFLLQGVSMRCRKAPSSDGEDELPWHGH
jgi:hypothetical protein